MQPSLPSSAWWKVNCGQEDRAPLPSAPSQGIRYLSGRGRPWACLITPSSSCRSKIPDRYSYEFMNTFLPPSFYLEGGGCLAIEPPPSICGRLKMLGPHLPLFQLGEVSWRLEARPLPITLLVKQGGPSREESESPTLAPKQWLWNFSK